MHRSSCSCSPTTIQHLWLALDLALSCFVSTASLAPVTEITGRVIHCVMHSARSLFSGFLFVKFSKLAIFLSFVTLFAHNSYKWCLVFYIFIIYAVFVYQIYAVLLGGIVYVNQMSITSRMKFCIQICFSSIDLEAFLTTSTFPRTSIENKHNEKK